MGVTRDADAIRLAGVCGVEDAEALSTLCRAAPDLPVDVSDAGPLHTAVVQALLEAGSRLRGTPTDPFAALFVVPALESERRRKARDMPDAAPKAAGEV